MQGMVTKKVDYKGILVPVENYTFLFECVAVVV